MNTPGNEVTPVDSSTGLESNVAGALSYVLGFITGIVFLVLEKNDRFVRFHAAQSIVVSVVLVGLSLALSILSAVLGFIPFLGWVLALLLSVGLGLLSFVLWVMLMYKAFTGQEWEVPIAGQFARKMIDSTTTSGNSVTTP